MFNTPHQEKFLQHLILLNLMFQSNQIKNAALLSMKLNLTKLIAIVTLIIAIALSSFDFALADQIESNSRETLEQAATEVVKDTGVEEQFGQSENGEQLLDQAQIKASHKLKEMAREADSKTELPSSKKLFIDNLSKKF